MTCNSGHFVVTGDVLSDSQTITCDYNTELWSHENANNPDRSWSDCRSRNLNYVFNYMK